MKYNKLVRDKIPEIMKAKGENPIVHIASDEEYSKKLQDKLREEVAEFIGSSEPEELADIIEVVYAICDLKKIDKKQLEDIRIKKAEERGGFSKRIILDEKN